jgi:hypothetical protein
MITLDESAKAALKYGESPMLCTLGCRLKRAQEALAIYDIDKAQAELGEALAMIEQRLRINLALRAESRQTETIAS